MIRVTMNLPDDLVEKVKATSVLYNHTMTDVIRRGIETQLFLNDKEREGCKILIERPDGTFMQVLFR